MNKLIVTTNLLLCYLFIAPAQASVPEMELGEARDLIDTHCPKCYKASEDEYFRGLEKLESAASEDSLSRDNLLLLASAYRQVAFSRYGGGEENRNDWLSKERIILEKLLVQEPDNIDVLHRLALASEGDERIAYLKRVLALDPDNVKAHARMGSQLYFGNVNKTEGLEYLREAFRISKSGQKVSVGRTLVRALETSDLMEEAKSVSETMDCIERVLKSKPPGGEPPDDAQFNQCDPCDAEEVAPNQASSSQTKGALFIR